MAAQIVKLSDEELATCKLRDITNIVKGKFTEEDIKALKAVGNDEKARRDLAVSLYKKYIDQVIEESKVTPAAEAANGKDVKNNKDEKPSEMPSTPSANSKTEAAKDVNINVYFTVSVKGVTGYSGTITCSCEHLLKILNQLLSNSVQKNVQNSSSISLRKLHMLKDCLRSLKQHVLSSLTALKILTKFSSLLRYP